MPWIITLTEHQAACATKALEIYARSYPDRAAQFRLRGRALTMPEDDALRHDFVQHGIWKTELELNRLVQTGDMPPQRRASLARSTFHLEMKVEQPDYYRGRLVSDDTLDEESDPAIGSRAPSHDQEKTSRAGFSRDWGVLDGQMVRLFPSRLAKGLRGLGVLISATLFLAALVSLFFGIWLIAIILAFAALGVLPRLKRRETRAVSGAWKGDCPSCERPIVVSDPDMRAASESIQSVCPHCRTGILVTRDRFEIAR